MKKIIILLSLLGVSFLASANSFTKYYEAIIYTELNKPKIKAIKPGQQVEVIYTSNLDNTNNELLERGYASLGRSFFIDRKLPDDLAKAQAKKIGASIVAIDRVNISTVSYNKNDDLNNLDYAYQYYSYFFAENENWKNPNILGLYFNNLSSEERLKYQRNTGGLVKNVVNNSRAFYANILPGDLIIAINDIPVFDALKFNDIKDEQLKSTKVLKLKIIRLVNNEIKETTIPVSFN